MLALCCCDAKSYDEISNDGFILILCSTIITLFCFFLFFLRLRPHSTQSASSWRDDWSQCSHVIVLLFSFLFVSIIITFDFYFIFVSTLIQIQNKTSTKSIWFGFVFVRSKQNTVTWYAIFLIFPIAAPKSNGAEPLNLRMDSSAAHSMYRFPFYNSFKNFHQHQSG